MEYNSGLIEGQRKDDFLGGTIPYEVRLESGDWTPYLPPEEWQKNKVIDTMACVTFSALNSVETQYKFLMGKDRNFSDRFTARMSGTTTDGNWLFRVADSMRRDGLVEENDWPFPQNYTWDEYYATPPIEIVNKARTFLNDFVIQYEWVDVTRESLEKHLKHAPIQVTIPGHAVLNFWRKEDVQKYFDSYEPFIKERKEPFVSAMKIVLTRKNLMTKEEVEIWYEILDINDPDGSGRAYWVGKPSLAFAKEFAKNKAAALEALLT